MAKKFYQTDEFLRISKEWEKRLEKSGFIDAEKGQQTVIRYRQNDNEWIESKALYYQALQECVSRARFDCEIDRIVMTLKAEGARITEICAALLANGFKKYRGTVRLVIRKYEAKWGIRTWKPEQLNYNLKLKRHIP